jgi:hypothetical protein
MKKYAIFPVLFVLVVIGCETEKEELSNVMTESAIVADTIFMPSQHGSGSGTTYSMSSGHIGISSVDVDIPEKYAIVFECEHGKFVIERMPDAREMWKNLRKGQSVKVYYQEKFRRIYEKDKQIKSSLIGYHFIRAVPNKMPAESVK